MKTDTIKVRIDPKRGKQVRAVLEAVGLKPTEAVNMFFARVIACGGIPFPVVKDETAELLNDADFLRHLGRMKRGEVRYSKFTP